MKSLFIKSVALMTVFFATNSLANPEGVADARRIPEQILLVKNASGEWTLMHGDQITFPDSEKDGFKIIKLNGKNGANSSSDSVNLSKAEGASDNYSADSSNPNNRPWPFNNAAGASLSNVMTKMAPYMPAIKAVAGAAMIGFSLWKLGGTALSLGMIAGLSTLGMPVATAIALTGVVTMSTGQESSLLGQVGRSIASQIPFFGRWFSKSNDEPAFVLPDVPTHKPGYVESIKQAIAVPVLASN